ncbi:hypothetical protein LUZ60_012032 [Juncus effusus]|nr:hypothetical protein LUZ60_012032 [Juncus effusus]
MAVSFLQSYNVSDLCIGKPALRLLPPSTTISETISALKRAGTAVGVGEDGGQGVAGRICMVDVLCYLCAEENLSSPSAALSKPISELLGEDSVGSVCRVERKTSVLDALDKLLNGAHYLVVPTHTRKNPTTDFSWLTPEDFIRFFLNNIAVLSPIHTQSLSSLNIIRPTTLTINHRSAALSAIPLLRAALYNQTSVAVLSDDNCLVGEISPSTLALSDELAAAAIAALPAGELISFLDCLNSPPASSLRVVKSRLRAQNMLGMLELLEPDVSSCNSSSGSTGNSSGSDTSGYDSSDEELTIRRVRRNRSYTARMGRKCEEAIVCHEKSSLVAVLVQALAHRVGYVWVVDGEYELVGIVGFLDILHVFREKLEKPFDGEL